MLEKNLIGALTLFTMENIKPNYSELERKYGVNRKTIRKYHLNKGIPPRTSTKRKYKLDAYKSQVEEKMTIPGITYQAAYQYFKAQHPDDPAFNSVSTFRWYVRDILKIKKTSKSIKPHVRFETKPGHQLQVDWKESLEMVSRHGEVFTFNLMTATWGYSRMHLWSYSRTKTTNDFIRCMIDILNQSGGMPQEVLTDNMSAVVSIQNGKKKKHPQILQFEKDMGFKIRLTGTRSPETKGKDESSNRFVNWLLPYDGQFEDEVELIEIIQSVAKQANQSINQTTQMPPMTLFRKEKETLSPLPRKILMESYLLETTTQIVPSTCLVRYQGSEYSVPIEYINKGVTIQPIDHQLYIYYNRKIIAIHPISDQRFNYDKAHYFSALGHSIIDEDQLKQQVEENLSLLNALGKKGFENNDNIFETDE